MPRPSTPATNSRFCSDCGTQLNEGARFCHHCGSPIRGRAASAPSTPGVSTALRWGVPVAAVAALVLLAAVQSRTDTAGAGSSVMVPPGAGAGAGRPLGAGTAPAPDISSMSPAERADRLFNRVMRLASEGKSDSAAFFGPMARVALESLAPLDAHQRYDIGLVALVTGDVATAAAQADTMLRERPTHLLGLAMAARAADARGDAVASKEFRRRLLAAEPAERPRALPEYTDHDADIRAAVELARKR